MPVGRFQAGGNERGEDEDESGDKEGGAEAVGEVAGDAHDVWSGESANGPDGVDEGDAGGSGGSAEYVGRERPEGSQAAPDARRTEEDCSQRQGGGSGNGAGDESQSGSDEAAAEVPFALSGAIGTAGDQKHGHGSERIGNGGEADDAEIAGVGNALDNDGQPETEGVESDGHGEIDGRKQPDGGAAEGMRQMRGGVA